MILDLDMVRGNGTYKKMQAKYATSVLLIINEWLLLKPTKAEQHDILELLHRRRKRSSTIFYSQYDPSGWYDQLGVDDSPLAKPSWTASGMMPTELTSSRLIPPTTDP